ncbi:MAG: LamG domain-containing protein, partial [Methanobacteriota archaeon]
MKSVEELQAEIKQVNKDLGRKDNKYFTLTLLLLLILGFGFIASQPAQITGASFLEVTGKGVLNFLTSISASAVNSTDAKDLDTSAVTKREKTQIAIPKQHAPKQSEKKPRQPNITPLPVEQPPLPPGKKEAVKKAPINISFVLEEDEKTDITKIKVHGKKKIKVKDNKGKHIARLEIDFDSPQEINYSNILAEMSFDERKAVLHSDNWTSAVLQRSLYIPSTGKGKVYICPQATTLEEVYPGCPQEFTVAVGETVNGVTLTTQTINGTQYYLANNVSGTGAGEITSITLISLSSGSANENLSLTFTVNETGLRNITDWRLYNSSHFNSIAVLNMPFEGGSNATFTKDYSTYSTNGTVTGALFNATGGYNGFGAYYFDGTSDYITIGSDLYETQQVGTITAWVKPENTGSVTQWIIFSSSQESSNTNLFQVHVRNISGTPVLEVQHYLGSGQNNLAHGSTNLIDGKWHHIAVTSDGTTWKLYVDGQEETTTPLGNGNSGDWFADLNPGTHTVNIGKRARPLDTHYFEGYIDQVQVYDRNLSTEQIQALYQNKTNIIVSQELNANEVWKACVTVTNETTEGETQCSNNATIGVNDAPIVSATILNSSSGTNTTSENLTLFIDASDADGDPIKNITDWKKGGTSIAILNLPFENHSLAATTAIDYSTNGNDGTVIGALFNASGGRDGFGAYDFDGNNDYIDTNFRGTGLTEMSVSMWFYLDKNASTKGTDVSLFSVVDAPNTAIIIEIDSADDILRIFHRNGGTNPGFLDATTPVTDGVWHNVVITMKDRGVSCTTDCLNYTIYLDGQVDKATTAYGQGSNIGRLRDFYIGAENSQGTASQFIDGKIDEVRVFNKELSAEQVLAGYNNRTDLIVSQETTKGDVWQACVTPNDGFDDGSTVCSNNLTIANTVPEVNGAVLNSSGGTNTTSENLTLFIDASDVDGDVVKNIADWRLWDGSVFSSIAVLNLPFESDGGLNASDYS